MKKGLSKFCQLIDKDPARKLVYRSQFPRLVIEIFEAPADGAQHIQDLLDGQFYVAVRADLDHHGEIPDSYLKEAARWWHFNQAPAPAAAPAKINSDAEQTEPVDLKPLFDILNGPALAMDCFGRDRNWLWQRVNGNLVNGRPAAFNAEQLTRLAAYLENKAQEVLSFASRIKASV